MHHALPFLFLLSIVCRGAHVNVMQLHKQRDGATHMLSTDEVIGCIPDSTSKCAALLVRTAVPLPIDQTVALAFGKHTLVSGVEPYLPQKSAEEFENHNSFDEFLNAPLWRVLLWNSLTEDQKRQVENDHGMTIVDINNYEPSFTVRVEREKALTWYEYLHGASFVRSIEDTTPPKLFDAYANYVMQTMSASQCNASQPWLGCNSMWNLGIEGEGSVLGIADSGIKTRHCFFNDPVCVPSDQSQEPPSCAGSTSYTQQVCSDCIDYCMPNQGVGCSATDLGHEKVRAYRAVFDNYRDDNSQHGTATCGTAVGNPTTSDTTSVQNRGIAPRARLAFTDISNDNGDLAVPTPLNTQFLPWFTTHGAKIQSHSWGSFSSFGYNSQAAAIDAYAWVHPDVLIAFSAGNSGAYDDFGIYLLLTAESHAKNALTVGATLNELQGLLRFASFASAHGLNGGSDSTRWGPTYVAQFSSNGPTLDWRIKPDVSAPGVLIVTALGNSARTNTPVANCDGLQVLAGWSGTSFSTPLIAGTAVLLREYLVSSGHSVNPSAALLKALLVVLAEPIGGINYYDDGIMREASSLNNDPNLSPFGSLLAGGFGVPIIGRVMQNTYIWDTFDSNSVSAFSNDDDEQAFCLQSSQLTSYSMALSYTDFPASPATILNMRLPKLVNDINLAFVYLDNNVCRTVHPNSLSQADNRNNMERVMTSANGASIALLHAYDINVAPQNWALAVHTDGSISTMQIELNQDDGSTTNLPANHACSQLYAACRAHINAIRTTEVSTSTTTQPPFNHAENMSSGTVLTLFCVFMNLVLLFL